MKKIIVIFMLLATSAISFGQPVSTPVVPVETDYLKKSRGQKTAAWILLGTGATIFAIVAPGNVSFDVLGPLVVVGGLATLGSIPFFIAGAKNKRKARLSSAIKMENTPVIQHVSLTNRSYPVMAIRISL